MFRVWGLSTRQKLSPSSLCSRFIFLSILPFVRFKEKREKERAETKRREEEEERGERERERGVVKCVFSLFGLSSLKREQQHVIIVLSLSQKSHIVLGRF